MNKYLIEILKIQDSIILPGLGALMVASQKTGKIVFNQHLKFNDGSLANFIAEKESIDIQDAQNQVAKFVREIEAVLGKGESYDMFEFGRFYKNKDGAVDFELAGAAKPVTNEKPAETPKKETLKKAEPKKPAPKKVKPVADVIKPEPEIKKETPKKKEADKVSPKETAKTKKKEEKAEDLEKKETKQAKNKFVPSDELEEMKAQEATKPAEKKVPIQEEKTPEKQEEVKSTSSPKQQKNKFVPTEERETKTEDKVKAAATIVASADAPKITGATETVSTTKETIKETTKEKVIVKEEKKKKRGFIWIILIILLLGLGAAGYFFKDKIMAWFDHEEDVEHVDEDHNDTNGDGSEDNLPQEAIALDSTAFESEEMIDTTVTSEEAETEEITVEEEEEAIVEEPVVNNVSNQGSNSGSYHLIGNSFGEKSNAERYVSEMSGKGYPAKILGRFDGLYLVSLKSYDSRDQAQSGRSSVTADASSAWILKYPK